MKVSWHETNHWPTKTKKQNWEIKIKGKKKVDFFSKTGQ